MSLVSDASLLIAVDGWPSWLYADGTILRVVSGGDGTDVPATGESIDDFSDDDKDDLGDAGKRALATERKARKDAEKAAKAAQDELSKVKQASMSDSDKALQQARDEGRAEAAKQAGDRLVRSEVRAAAAGKLQDPSDAPALLGDLSRFVGEDGEIDDRAVESAIDELLQSKPYLAASGAKPTALPGGGAKPPSTTSMNDLIRDAARRR